MTSESTEHNEAELAEGKYAVYANNCYLDASFWDITLQFGQLSQDRETQKAQVDWHTDVTIPWLQAKLLAYFLQIQIANFEAQNGKIPFPNSLLPAPPPEPTEGAGPATQKGLAAFRKIYDRFIEDLTTT